ncbi:hypothetical protein HS125_01425 [bacterium]|nr:hypothetical protein [bacterium]
MGPEVTSAARALAAWTCHRAILDPGCYLHAIRPRSAAVKVSSESTGRWTLITTAHTAWLTGMRREESERDALSRSRGESLDLLARALISLTLPDGRKVMAEQRPTASLLPGVARAIARIVLLVDRAESSVEVDYELPLAPLAESLGLGVEPSSRQAVPESARAAARRAALADFDARVPLWAGREAEVRAWLSTEGRRLAQSDTHALSYTHVYVVEIEIPQKEIPLSLNKRLYADSWFPLCHGYATW